MNTKRTLGLITVLALIISLFTACGGCKHNYQERDGRVVCLDCKEVCDHTYQIDGANAYCSNCLFSCKHSFADANGEMVCSACGLKCSHKFVQKDGEAACEYCQKKCAHDYEVNGAETKCKICQLPCTHKFAEKDGDMVCGTCGVSCAHEYAQLDGAFKCKHCGLACAHEFEEANGKKVCKKCGAEKLVLTAENVNDYFTVSVKISDVTVTDNYILGNDMGRANADITISSKKGVKYDNVVLTVLLETSSGGWISQSREVEVDFDGNGTKSFNFSSRTEKFVSKNPSFKAKITGVTGEIAG